MASARTLLNEKREEILRLAALHGAANVRVFGSVARGEDRDDSDIDLLVHMEDDRSLLDMIRFWDQVGNLLGRKVDVVDDESLHYVIRDEILSEARPL